MGKERNIMMKHIAKMIVLLGLCAVLTACAQETPVADGIENTTPEIRQEVISTPVAEDTMQSESAAQPETPEKEIGEEVDAEEADVEENGVDEEAPSVAEEAEAAGAEGDTVEEPCEEESEDSGISDEEWAYVLQAYENWKAEQDRIAAGIVEEPRKDEDEWEPEVVIEQVTRSEEEVLRFVSNFVANYKNTESYRNLEGEGIEFLEDCLHVLRTDPASEKDIAMYMEKYRRGSYDDEMFRFMLECWIEFGGSFGEGCIIYVQ